jgi:hypothetical protein
VGLYSSPTDDIPQAAAVLCKPRLFVLLGFIWLGGESIRFICLVRSCFYFNGRTFTLSFFDGRL